MPKIWGVKLEGELPDWVSAKDVILEMLRRHDVDGGIGKIIEYYGPGLRALSAMDRHVIANMGAELGATATVFPSDEAVKEFLKSQGRSDAWREILADANAEYDEHEEINLSGLEPLVALPSSPGARGGGQGNLPVLYRIVRQSWAARLCHCRPYRGRQTGA